MFISIAFTLNLSCLCQSNLTQACKRTSVKISSPVPFLLSISFLLQLSVLTRFCSSQCHPISPYCSPPGLTHNPIYIFLYSHFVHFWYVLFDFIWCFPESLFWWNFIYSHLHSLTFFLFIQKRYHSIPSFSSHTFLYHWFNTYHSIALHTISYNFCCA